MPNIELNEANAWTDKTKAFLTELETDLEAAQAAEVLARLSSVYAVSGWTTPANTPALVRKIIAMLYVGWYYQRTYSEDEESNSYGLMLIAAAENLLDGLTGSTILLEDVEVSPLVAQDSVSFYPTDLSSANAPTVDDPSLGGPAFTMGKIW